MKTSPNSESSEKLTPVDARTSGDEKRAKVSNKEKNDSEGYSKMQTCDEREELARRRDDVRVLQVLGTAGFY